MSNQIQAILNKRKQEIARTEDIKLRKHLNADALFTVMRTGFAGLRDHRSGKITHKIGRASCRERVFEAV